jgi:hypothetical protein
MNMKIALIDNDYSVRAKTDFDPNGKNESFKKFFHQIKEDLLPGQRAYLEIKDPGADPITFEISQLDCPLF